MTAFLGPIRWRRGLSAFAALFLLGSSTAQARPKTDVVILENGDRVTCEIRSLKRGLLTVKTNGMGTLEIEWDRVEQVRSTFIFQVELQSGARLVGSLDHLPEEGRLVVAGAVGTSALEYERVVTLTPIEANFLQRIDGSIDLGYSYTKAQSATQWSLDADAKHTTPRYRVGADLSSQLQTQKDAEDVNRQNLDLYFNWLLREKWFAIGLGSFQKNASQGLDLRALVGGALSRYLIQTNRTLFSVAGGLSFSRERYENGDPFQSNTEVVASTRLEIFRYRFPEIDISASWIVFPSLTTGGRIRSEFDSKLRFEILRNFYWSLSFYDTYDSKPPTQDFAKNDFGVTTALGWSF